MAKSDIGTKRICPETGRKFYDLNKDPIVSPYTGMSYPLSFFQTGGSRVEEEEEVEEKEVETEDESAPEIVSLEDAEEDDSDGDAIPGIEDEEDVEIDDDDDDTFLAADDDDDDDDVSDIIGVDDEDEN
ncbi:TIGR02300 family protein [Chelativorans sp. ZYF759]|uniref:TIGR02300 family protein n=1 Tax=Chelativorans sp. ZYF759 TaxID=2692213 RepID=UPI00145DB40A|nr:TIGR02300 family protein [Chelativorans sp. ZYF759]